MNCATITNGNSGAVAWCCGAHMGIRAVALGSIVRWDGDHSHLTWRQWCRRLWRQALAAA